MSFCQTFLAATEDDGIRLDRYLVARLPELSRSRIAELIDEQRVRVNGRAAKRSHKVAAGERIEIEVLPRPSLDAVPEAIPLEILYEDEDVIVVNKAAGMTIHAGAGATRGTLVNALMHRFKTLSQAGGPLRPGIVHRLDKDTSGVLVVARNDEAHRRLADAFRERRVEKIYVALVHGKLKQESGRIELAVARDLKRRTRMTTRRSPREGRSARTDWQVLARLDGFTLVAAQIHTGRTHQIRVHFSAIGHPVVGDVLYGAPRIVPASRKGAAELPPLGRNFLHAARIRFEHPRRAGEFVEVAAPLPLELRSFLEQLARGQGKDAGAILAEAEQALP